MNYLRLGAELKRAREAAGLTQKQISDRLNVTAQTVSAWENGRNKIDIDTFSELCKVYGIDFANTLKLLNDGSDNINPSQNSLYGLNPETVQIARAYENADKGTQSAVRKLLDIKDPPHIPDMKEIKKFAEEVFKNENMPTKK
ncbi:XRE family transcriptional regulator [Anaerotruncus sp. AF02-27]|uniref:helix-turn-helix domain-containing protein n=1 Tax=Anaerotruncus sp. AF02-27 TaxID=2292191 RepID=UPI000E512739|nr:helix-turn-helix transcriptional regulator [Anaerotruncus sp. AF02-27]RGX51502.1 XRE family transcriptional regulator [Anaerotruncus sp. AF02-27]